MNSYSKAKDIPEVMKSKVEFWFQVEVTTSHHLGPSRAQLGTTSDHVIGPTCHYDVTDTVFVAKRRGRAA